ncbi:ABC transporter ATP-binding protein [Virgibacillus profundi]|uniref:ABC transporter ATP-binding protein n=1 Tax=Virgibacillus profundi TaxID=2024555 RepID=A0A2A2I9X4_9BACI|nr:ABC transporter ATP-binding protein [Virgibacillus profundi]PAV28126.1 ABC transporter ATP-binding protein [Virgibacillus profundi]PXY52431.1 ABC transporter ATP-binding protein [Virgibacillus profundi]
MTTLLTVKNLSKTYDSKAAVKNISFEFQSGKCIALIGPNGAGKTTILRTLAGLLKPSSGTVKFTDMKENDDLRKHIGYLPQYPVFYSWMTGMEFLVYSGQLAFLSKTEAGKRAEDLLVKVGISEAKHQRIGKYSGGMKQRLGIAQAIIHKPKLLMLDEPVSSLDPIGRREVLTLMEELKKEMTILFSTHILSDADEISDELLLLRKGEIVEAGSMSELRQKYQTSKIELEFQDDLENYQLKVNKLTNVMDSYIDRNVLHVTATDIIQARQEILTAAANENWPLTNFTLNRASLEDMFMKVVNN